jgi:hypothetical protein
MSAKTLALIERVRALDITLGVAEKHRKQLRRSRDRLKNDLTKTRLRLDTRNKALLVVEYLINRKHDKVIGLFESTVTSALMDLFDDKHSFKFQLGRHGDNLTCEYAVHTGKYKGYLSLRMNQGNAIKEIIAVVISTIVVKLDKRMPKFIVLDEKLGGVSSSRQVLAGNFLKRICNAFGIQYIVVTQSEEFASTADNFINLKELYNERASVGRQV